MNSKILKKLIFIWIFSPISLVSQQVNTLYFMENVPIRNNLNPAFQPSTQSYISLPIIGFLQFNVGNNSLSIKDVIYNVNGKTISFLHPDGDVNRFYNTLKETSIIRADFQTNLLSFGFKYKTAFFNFSLIEKVEGFGGIPKDFFRISLYGTTSINSNSFNLRGLQTDITAYTEAAVGYSKQLNDQLTVGTKVKFLVGNANVSNSNGELSIEANAEKWTLKGSGVTNFSMPSAINISDNLNSIGINKPTKVSDWVQPLGYGAGLDFGATYLLTDRITFSAALLDIGFINWKQNVQNVNFKVDYTLDGVGQINSSDGTTSFIDVYNRLVTENALVDSLSQALIASNTNTQTSNTYTVGTTAKLNLGIEYELYKKYLSLGLLSRTFIFKKMVSEEITASVNARPTDWFNATASYSIVNGEFGSIGAGIGLKTGFINWFAAADYIPFQKTTLYLTQPINMNIPLPYNTKNVNFSMGVNLVFDNRGVRKYKSNEKAGRLEGLKFSNRNQTNKSNSQNNSSKIRSKKFTKIAKKRINQTNSNPDCRCESY